MSEAAYETLSYEETDGVGRLTLQRPEVRNALDPLAYAELEEVVRGCRARCLVITGAGSAFCSGDDVRAFMTGSRPRRKELALTPAAGALLATGVPVIAAVNGPAVGWGMELALMADLRVAARSARFAELFVLRGLCADVAGLGRLAQLVGREKAAELLFTGDAVDADEALRIGLVSRVVPDEHLLAEAHDLAARIAARPPLAVATLKEGLRRALDPDWEVLGRWVAESLQTLFDTDDHKEGVAAFLERRPPTFRGR